MTESRSPLTSDGRDSDSIPFRMKLAILGSRGYPSTYGGYETLVRHLAPYLVRNGHDVTVYCRSEPADLRQRGASDRAPGRRPRSSRIDGIRCVRTPGYDSKSLSTLTYGLTATLDATFRGYDSILVLNIANGFWLPALVASRTPVAVNTDGIEWERGKWSRVGRLVFRAGAWMTARIAQVLVCDSLAIGRIWLEVFHRDSVYVPYGAPISSVKERDKLDEVVPADDFLLVVARLAPENNVELTLDALDVLGDQAPPAVIVGSANFDSPIEARLRAMQSAGRLRWLGHVADQQLLTQLWSHCAVYVHGHSVGGTNPALLQALGAGAPTLALDTEYNSEVLEDDEQLYPADAVALAGKILATTSSRALRARMTTRGQSIVRQRYSWESVCEAYEETLISLANGDDPMTRSSVV